VVVGVRGKIAIAPFIGPEALGCLSECEKREKDTGGRRREASPDERPKKRHDEGTMDMTDVCMSGCMHDDYVVRTHPAPVGAHVCGDHARESDSQVPDPVLWVVCVCVCGV
jgi:hypothetical protein